MNSPSMDELGLALPVGISFYTFQTMSYTIDIYRKRISPYNSFVEFGCYASFFPQLVAGPIVRADEFQSQIQKPLRYNPAHIRIGLTLIIYGVFKKVVFAIFDDHNAGKKHNPEGNFLPFERCFSSPASRTQRSHVGSAVQSATRGDGDGDIQ